MIMDNHKPLKVAYIKYRDSIYGPYNKFEYVPLSAVSFTINSEPIQPKDADDYEKEHRYSIQLCYCDKSDYCLDLSKCERYTTVAGFIVKLGASEDDIQKSMSENPKRMKVPKKLVSSNSETETIKKAQVSKKSKIIYSKKEQQVNDKNFLEQSSLIFVDSMLTEKIRKNRLEKNKIRNSKAKGNVHNKRKGQVNTEYFCDKCQAKFQLKSILTIHIQICYKDDEDNFCNTMSDPLEKESSEHLVNTPLALLSSTRPSIRRIPKKNLMTSFDNVDNRENNMVVDHLARPSNNQLQHNSTTQSLSNVPVVNPPNPPSQRSRILRRFRKKRSNVRQRKGRHTKEIAILSALRYYAEINYTDEGGERGGPLPNNQMYLNEGEKCNQDDYNTALNRMPKAHFRFIVKTLWPDEVLAYRCQIKRKTYVTLEGGEIKELTPQKKRLCYSLFHDYLKATFKSSKKISAELLKVTDYYSEFIRNVRLWMFELESEESEPEEELPADVI